MTPYRMLALILVVVLLATAAMPARAEAMEVGTILLIASAAVVVVILVVYLVVANMTDRRRVAVPDETATTDAIAAEPVPVAVAAYVVTTAVPESQ